MFDFLNLDKEPLDIFDYLSFFLFLLLTIFIVYPWFSSGYLLTRDMIVTPSIKIPLFSSSYFLKEIILHGMSKFVPTYVIQKVILFSVIFLSMVGMYKLMSWKIKSVTAKIFAAIFYVFNPFFYERLVDGQWTLLVGYMLFPFFIKTLFLFFKKPKLRNIIWLSILLTVISSFSTHFLFISLFSMAIFVFFNVVFNDYDLEVYFYLLLSLILFFILNINWVFPLILGTSSEGMIIASIVKEDLMVFQTVGDKSYGLLFNILSGYGYWAETTGEFILPKDRFFLWPIFSILFFVIFLYGLIVSRNKLDRPIYFGMVSMFFISIFLSVGVASELIRENVFILYEKFTIIRGFREPQKFVAIIVFLFAFFSAFSIESIIPKFIKKYSFLIIFFPLIYVYPIFFGLSGQIKPVFYPESWKKANLILKNDNDDYLVLVLPWHQYMRFNFANTRVIANPANYYFQKPVLSSENYETDYLYSHDVRPEALHIEGLLEIQRNKTNLLGEMVRTKIDWSSALGVINIKYIILFKESDWKDYNFLNNSEGFVKTFDSDQIVLYKNKFWSGYEQD